jgi:hypothetical protein
VNGKYYVLINVYKLKICTIGALGGNRFVINYDDKMFENPVPLDVDIRLFSMGVMNNHGG